jgi:hypothetical protein
VAITKTVEGLVVADGFNRADSTTVGGNWNERSGDWSISGNALYIKDATAGRWIDNTAGSGGEMFVQALVMPADPDGASEGYPAIVARADWNGGSINGYVWQPYVAADVWRLFKVVNGTFTQLGSDIAATVQNGIAGIAQLYVADGVQEARGYNLGGGAQATLAATDPAHNGQNSRVAALRASWSGGAGIAAARIYDNFVWCTSKRIVVTGLESGSGRKAKVINSSGAVVAEATESGGTATIDCSLYSGVTESIPTAGWAKLRITTSADSFVDEFVGAVFPGSTFAWDGEPGDAPGELLWSLPGAVAATTASVVVRLDDVGEVELEYDTDPAFGSPASVGPTEVDGDSFAVRFDLTSLPANTQHYYRVMVNGGAAEAETGAFKTAPNPGTAASFVVAAAGDSAQDSSHAVYGELGDEAHDLFLHLGDLHHDDINDSDAAEYRDRYDHTVGVAVQNAAFRGRAWNYIWDDHDYGVNDGDGTASFKATAQQVYRELVPHYTLPGTSGGVGPIYHAFTWGRVRFICTDGRSERSAKSATDDGDKTYLGTTQKAWFEQECLDAKEAGLAIIWVQDQLWLRDTEAGADDWAGYNTERTELADFFQTNGLNSRIATVSADMHALGIDDGTNSNFATSPSGDGPVVMAASALSHPEGTLYTPTMSEGYHGNEEGEGQYVLIGFTDAGGTTISVTCEGYRVSAAGDKTLWGSLAFTLDAGTPPTKPVISVAQTGPEQITVTLTSGGVGADDFELYLQEATATGLFDAENLAVDEIGPPPMDPIVIDGVVPGTTVYLGLRAINAVGSTDSDAVSIEIPVARLDVVAITYQSATLQLVGITGVYAVRFVTALLAESDYDPVIDDSGAKTGSDRYYHALADLDPATELRSRVTWQEDEGGPWSEPLEVLWETLAAPADTSVIVSPKNGEPVSGTECIVVSLGAGRSVATIQITPWATGTPVTLADLCPDWLLYADGWYTLTITTDLGTVLTSTFRVDNSYRVGQVGCEEILAGERAGSPDHVWEASNLLFWLGCTVLGRSNHDCFPYPDSRRGFLLIPESPSGADMRQADSQRISAFMTLDPNCRGADWFYPHLGQELMFAGLAALVSKKPGHAGTGEDDYYGVWADAHIGYLTPYFPGLWEQTLRIRIDGPGHAETINIAFPEPVLAPWWPRYDWIDFDIAEGVSVDLEVQRVGATSTYRVRVLAAGTTMYDELHTFTSPLPEGLPGLTQVSFGGACHWAGIQLTDVPRPCTLLLEVYEDDRTTVAWSVATDPSHPYPYLCEPANYGEQEIDPVAGAASIGQVEVVVIDRRQTEGDQDSGWLTAKIHDVHGRRCRLRRFTGEQEPGWVTLADGPADTPSMDDTYAAFRWVIRDTRETERKLRAFTESTLSVLPVGVIGGFGYNAETDTYLADPMVPLTGTFVQNKTDPTTSLDQLPEASTGYVDVSAESLVIPAAAYDLLWGALKWPLGAMSEHDPETGVPIRSETYYRTTFPTLTLYWRAAGSSDPWTVITSLGLEGTRHETHEGHASPGYTGVIFQNLADATPSGDDFAVAGVFIGDMAETTSLPTHGQEIEFYVRSAAKAGFIFHLDGYWPLGVWHQFTAGELLRDLYDGVYSPRDPETGEVVPTGIRYDAAALALMTDAVCMRLTEPVDDLRAWAEKHVYAPTGWIPALDYDGRISPMYQAPEANFVASATQLTDAITEPSTGWDAGKRIVNRVSFTYQRLYDPTGDAEALDGIAVREVTQEYRDVTSELRHGEQKVEYEGDVFCAIGDADGAATGTELAATLAEDRWSHVGDRYADGAQAVSVAVMREYTYHLRAGDFVLVNHSWFPDSVTRRRGLIMGGQIVSIGDLDCAWRRVVVEEVLNVSGEGYDPDYEGDNVIPPGDTADIANARVERVLPNTLRVLYDHDDIIQQAAYGVHTVTVNANGPVLQPEVAGHDARADGEADSTPNRGYVEFLVDGTLDDGSDPDAVETVFTFRLDLYENGAFVHYITCTHTDYVVPPPVPVEGPSSVGLAVDDPLEVTLHAHWLQVTDENDARYWWDIRIEWFVAGVWLTTENVTQRNRAESTPIDVPWNDFNTEVYARLRYYNSSGDGPWVYSESVWV